MKCLFYFIFSLFSNIVSSQFIVINGRVLSEKRPVASANVVLMIGDSTCGYTFTDKNGKFSLTIPTTVLLPTLTISHLSIEKTIVSLKKDDLSLNKEIIIEAIGRVSKLPDVQVESVRKGFSQNGDTTSFAVSQYSDGSEIVLEDLLKKIPGVKVSEDGKISFRGKQISRILFEGTDFYKDKYRIVTKNLTNKIVDSVQAIENFNPNSLLKGIASDNETILNVVVKDNIKDRISGNANLNLGNAYEVALNSFLINKSYQIVGLYSGNNIGITETGLFEEDNTKVIISNINSFSLPITEIQIPETFLGFKKSIPNDSHLGNLSFGKNKQDKISITANISLEKNKQWRSVLTNESFITYPDSLFLNSFRYYNNSVNKIIGAIEVKNTFSKKSTLANYFDIAYSEENINSNISLPSSVIFEQSKLPSVNLLHTVELTKKINKNVVFVLSGGTQYSNKSQSYLNNDGLRYDPNGSIVPTTLANDIFQKSNTLAGNLSARLFLKSGGAKFVLGLSSTFSRTNLSISTKAFDSIRYQNQIIQNNDNYYYKIFGQSEFTVKKISFSVNGGASFINNSIFSGQNNILFNAKAGIKWSPTKKDILLFFASVQPNLNELNNFSVAPLVKDYRTIQYNLSNWKNYNNTNIGIVYGYNNFFKSFDLSASIIMQKKSLSIVRFFTFSGFNTRSFLDFGPPTRFFTSNLSVGKYISALNIYVKVDFLKSFNEYFNAVGSSSLEKFSIYNNSFGSEIRSSFDHYFNFTGKVKIGIQNVLVDLTKNNSSVNTVEIGAKTRFRLSTRLQFVIDATKYAISTRSKSIKTAYSLFNAEIKYGKPRTKWHLLGKAINIGNVSTIRNFSFSDIMISSEEIIFLGRRITVGGAYLF